MFRTRRAGILLHPTSLPGPHGIGTLGPDAIRFLDFLAASGASVWQVLPLGPTGFGDSPYQSFSAFAGNPLLIDTPHAQHEDGSGIAVDFSTVIGPRRDAVARYAALQARDEAYQAFVEGEADWLRDYALYAALKNAHGGAAWYSWPEPLARHDGRAIEGARTELANEIDQLCMEQYLFAQQLNALRAAAAARGIALMGDLPIYVAHDSADVWAHQEQFALQPDGQLIVQAGVPPDYFSPTGQLWGNPIYLWDRMERDGFAWWIARVRHALRTFDMIRIDHFRGFESYWEVPGGAATAVDGRWVRGPGFALFDALNRALDKLPVVAENLGLITPEVEQLRERCGFPGMSVLQFAFGPGDEGREHRPHSIAPHSVIYTGTHDNDTTVGWWNSLPIHLADVSGASDAKPEGHDVRAHVRSYLNTSAQEIHWDFIRSALASVADVALVPMQDVIGVGSSARMNLPGRERGNWSFRFTWDQAPGNLSARFAEMVDLYDRRLPLRQNTATVVPEQGAPTREVEPPPLAG